jgi:co-chaperonin GroES (HSP10)
MIEAANKNYIIEALGHDRNTTTSGGIIIQHNDQTELAQIVSIGPDIEKNPIPVGTKVVVSWGAVVQIKVGNKKVFVIHADNILGIVKDEE